MRVLLAFMLLGVAWAENKASFSSKLYYKIAHSKPNESIIISTASIESCLGLAYMGAKGETAKEMHKVLQLTGETKDEVGQKFGEYIKKVKSSSVKLIIANRVYLADRYDIAPKYNKLTSKYFGSEAQKVDFSKPETVKNINAWVEDQTNKKIKNLLKDNSVDSSTSAVLINAIYFKANWKYKFNKTKTVDEDFYISAEKKVPVKMMHENVMVNYGVFNELDATAIELPYGNSNIRMLVILPNKIDGLAGVEKKLKDVDLTKLLFSKEAVELQIPKFKVEFGINLNSVLQKLGLKKMFNGGFSDLTTSKTSFAISDVEHKAFIEVDEEGTEAAAATAAITKRTVTTFIVNHPFFFAIIGDDTVFFSGHVVKI